MPHDFAHTLFELRRKAGATTFNITEALTIIRTITDKMSISFDSIQTQLRGPTYFVEDNAVLRNFIINPSFEHDLISWTESITATGSTSRDSTKQNSGDHSLKLEMTNASGSGDVVERQLVITGLEASEVWSASVAVDVTSLSNCVLRFRLEFLDAADAVLATHHINQTTTTSGFVTLKVENKTAPTNTTKLRVRLLLRASAGSATGVSFCDSVIAEKASLVGSYFDGDSQDSFWETVIHAGESINDVDGTAAICGYFKASA